MQQCSKCNEQKKLKHVHYLRSLNPKLCNITTTTNKKVIDNVLCPNDVNMNMMMRNSVLKHNLRS